MSKMLENDGVYTNYLPSDEKMQYATGHDVLSESQGLLMEYAIKKDYPVLFNNTYNFVENNMFIEKAISYRLDFDGTINNVNAAVDDLRIIAPLLQSTAVFDIEENYNKALEYSNNFLDTNVVDGYMVDYYNPSALGDCDFITLCYSDFKSMQSLALINPEYQLVFENMIEITNDGYISDSLPFYQTRYNYTSSSYETTRINMVECVLTMVHLAEVGALNNSSLNYIKTLIDEGIVYSVYNLDGTNKNDEQSTAVYGLCALLGDAVNDRELYEKSIELMNQFQVLDENSEVYGGYADADTLQAYSFDNLIALLALAER